MPPAHGPHRTARHPRTATTIRTAAWLASISLIFSASASDIAPAPNESLFAQALAQPADEGARLIVDQLTLAEKIAQLQNAAPAVTRLGWPAHDWWSEGLHGLARNGHATVFPQAIGLAASWDTDLLRRVGRTVALEARAKFDDAAAQGAAGARYAGLSIWSPNINILRDPRWGRGQETYGEDPQLTARLGVAYVQGVQGDDPDHPFAIATPKHYAVHSGPEPGRHGFKVQPSAHDLEETYLPAFRAAVTDGRAGSVMCAYNAVDGDPACANADLLQRRLRGDWGFTGYVTTDCDAVEDMVLFQHSAADAAEASAQALQAGTDLNCGRSFAALAEAAARGRVSAAAIDQAARRLVAARLRLASTPPAALAAASAALGDTGELALRAARESMVLLKNAQRPGSDGPVLPLRRGLRLAVVGPTADLRSDLEGNYHGAMRAPVTPLDGLRRVFGADHVVHAQGAVLAARVPVSVPATALRSASGAPGLDAEYRAAADFAAEPVVRRREDHIDVDIERASPAPGVPAGRHATRWQGWLVPPAAGTYQLGLAIDRCFDCSGHDLARLWLDGRLLQSGRSDALPARLHFRDTRPHALTVELVHDSADGGIALQWLPPARAQLDEAVAAARAADAVVAFVGLSPALEGEELRVAVPGFQGGDRTSLDLPAPQEALLRAVHATGKPLIVVLQSGSAVALNWAAAHADAVLVAWYPGQAGGTAVAETLAGDVDPAGRLPMTFYRSAADLPAFADYTMQGRTYRHFAGKPLYAFGHGLSYGRRAYGGLRLSADALAAGQPLTVEVEVRNTGSRDGDEVVQVYIEPPPAAGAPRRWLAAFQRVPLATGESRRVRFELGPRELSTVSADGLRAVRAGVYSVTAGGGQPGHAEVVRAPLRIDGEATLPR